MSRVRNPLAGIAKPQLLAQVATFCAAYGLSDKLAIFEKGALVAQSAGDFENIQELNEEDKVPLRREVTRKVHTSLGWALYANDEDQTSGTCPRPFGLQLLFAR